MIEAPRADALAERLFGEINAAMSTLVLYVGWRLGLFRALRDAGPCTADALAARTALEPRYVREWLSCVAAGRYVEHADGRFWLTPEQVVVYLDADHPAHALPNVGFVASLASVLPRLLT